MHDAGWARRRPLVARRTLDRLRQPYPRPALRSQGRELAVAQEDRTLLLPAQRRGLGLRSSPTRLRGCIRRHGKAAQPHTRRVPARRGQLAGRFVRGGHHRPTPRHLGSRSRPATSTWFRSTARSWRSPSRPAHTARPSVSPDGGLVGFIGQRRPADLPAEHQGRRDAHRRHRTAMDQRGPRSHLHPDRWRPPAGVARRRAPDRHRRGPRRHAPVRAPCRRTRARNRSRAGASRSPTSTPPAA